MPLRKKHLPKKGVKKVKSSHEAFNKSEKDAAQNPENPEHKETLKERIKERFEHHEKDQEQEEVMDQEQAKQPPAEGTMTEVDQKAIQPSEIPKDVPSEVAGEYAEDLKNDPSVKYVATKGQHTIAVRESDNRLYPFVADCICTWHGSFRTEDEATRASDRHVRVRWEIFTANR